MPVIKCTIT